MESATAALEEISATVLDDFLMFAVVPDTSLQRLDIPFKGESSGSTETVRLVFLSDTHSLAEASAVPAGDVLLHAGDFTRHCSVKEITAFNTWLGTKTIILFCVFLHS